MASTVAALTELYDRWMSGIQDKDMAALEQIIAPEYIYSATGQGRWSRARWFETVAIYDIVSFELRSIDVLEYGDVAVAVTEYEQEARVDGEPRSGRFLITDTWVRRDERWQVVARSSILQA